MNAAIYARVSTAAQAEHGYSLETQIEACKQKAIALGATSIKEYVDDGYSGAYLERPALDDLRDALAAKLHDYVIIYDTDRLARDTMLLLLITEEIEKTATLVYVNSEYTKTPEGQLFYEIRGSFAKYERIKIQDRFARGRRGKLRRGLPIMDSHVYGYDFIDGKYAVNEREAAVVRMIFDYYINHSGGQKKVIETLHAKGIPSPLGTAKWSSSVVCNILRRQQYTGEYYALQVYRKKVGVKKIEEIKRDSSEWIPMTCPAIISKETFQKAEEKRNRNKIQKVRETKYHALLQGIAYCGVCGRKMLFQHHCDKGKEYYFYKCNSQLDTPCGNRTMQASIIDAVVWQELKKLCKSEKSIKTYIAQHEPPQEKVIDVKKELDKINQQRNAIMNWFSQNYISAEQCTEKLQMLKMQEERLIQDNQPKRKTDTEKIVSAVKQKAVSFESKRNIILSVCQKVMLTRTGTPYGKSYDIIVEFVFR